MSICGIYSWKAAGPGVNFGEGTSLPSAFCSHCLVIFWHPVLQLGNLRSNWGFPLLRTSTFSHLHSHMILCFWKWWISWCLPADNSSAHSLGYGVVFINVFKCLMQNEMSFIITELICVHWLSHLLQECQVCCAGRLSCGAHQTIFSYFFYSTVPFCLLYFMDSPLELVLLNLLSVTGTWSSCSFHLRCMFFFFPIFFLGSIG